MEIKTRYNIGDGVFIIRENKIQKMTVSEVLAFAEASETRVAYRFSETPYEPQKYENDIFPSKEALLEYLQSE